MTKVAILFSAVLLFAGVAAAGSLTSGRGSDTPTVDTTIPAATTGTTTRDDDRQAGEISGPCDEAEHANDPRCTGAAGAVDERGRDDRGDDHRNSGPGNAEDNNSGHRGGNSGRGHGEDD